MELSQAIDDVRVYCRVRRQLSPRTTKNYYGYPLRAIFLPWCLERPVTELAEVLGRPTHPDRQDRVLDVEPVAKRRAHELERKGPPTARHLGNP